MSEIINRDSAGAEAIGDSRSVGKDYSGQALGLFLTLYVSIPARLLRGDKEAVVRTLAARSAGRLPTTSLGVRVRYVTGLLRTGAYAIITAPPIAAHGSRHSIARVRGAAAIRRNRIARCDDYCWARRRAWVPSVELPHGYVDHH